MFVLAPVRETDVVLAAAIGTGAGVAGVARAADAIRSLVTDGTCLTAGAADLVGLVSAAIADVVPAATVGTGVTVADVAGPIDAGIGAAIDAGAALGATGGGTLGSADGAVAAAARAGGVIARAAALAVDARDARGARSAGGALGAAGAVGLVDEADAFAAGCAASLRAGVSITTGGGRRRGGVDTRAIDAGGGVGAGVAATTATAATGVVLIGVGDAGVAVTATVRAGVGIAGGIAALAVEADVPVIAIPTGSALETAGGVLAGIGASTAAADTRLAGGAIAIAAALDTGVDLAIAERGVAAAVIVAGAHDAATGVGVADGGIAAALAVIGASDTVAAIADRRLDRAGRGAGAAVSRVIEGVDALAGAGGQATRTHTEPVPALGAEATLGAIAARFAGLAALLAGATAALSGDIDGGGGADAEEREQGPAPGSAHGETADEVIEAGGVHGTPLDAERHPAMLRPGVGSNNQLVTTDSARNCHENSREVGRLAFEFCQQMGFPRSSRTEPREPRFSGLRFIRSLVGFG